MENRFLLYCKKAKVPIICAALDFKNKQILISKPFDLTDDINEDISHLKIFFKGVKGKIPEYS